MISITDYFITIIKLIIEKKLISIFATRTLFIYSSLIYNGLGYITTIKNSDDYKCMINLTLEEEEIIYYVQHICLLGLSLLNETFNSKEIYDKIVLDSNVLLSSDDYKEFKEKYSNELNQIEIELHDYYYMRDRDGWHDSNEQILLSNDKSRIVLNGETQWDKINLRKWTPFLEHKMIGGNWGKVKSVLDKKIINQIENLFKTEYSNIDLVFEHNKILDSSINFKEDSLIQAEFWMGIDDHFTIGGFFNYLLINYLENNYINILDQINLFNIINTGIFQTSIIVYKLKYELEDPRPIQIIRGSQISKTIKYYFGESNTNNWLPFKNYDLTPLPSNPDWPSDVSAISSVASFILSIILSENNNDFKINIKSDDIKFIDLSGENENQDINLKFIKLPKNCSKVLKKNPIKDIIIKIDNWDDLAKHIGNSVVISGISTNISNNAGYNIGINIGKAIIDYFAS